MDCLNRNIGKSLFSAIFLIAINQNIWAQEVFQVRVPDEAQVKKVTCQDNFLDVKKDGTVAQCFGLELTEVTMCESEDYGRGYSKKINDLLPPESGVDLQAFIVSRPMSMGADGKAASVERKTFYKDRATGRVLYIESFTFDKDNKVTNRQVYADPNSFQYKNGSGTMSFSTEMKNALGISEFAGGENADIEFERSYRELVEGTSGLPSLKGCDFIASSSKGDTNLSGLSFGAQDVAGGSPDGQASERFEGSDRSDAFGAQAYEGGRGSITPHKCFESIKRPLSYSEAQCYSDRLGIVNDATSLVARLGEVSQVTLLQYLTTSLLSTFMDGYIESSGKTIDPTDLQRINPDCGLYSDFVLNSQAEKSEALAKKLSERKKRHEAGSHYLKALVKEAKVNHKNNVLLPPGHNNPIESYTLKELIETKKALNTVCKRGARDEKNDYFDCEAEASYWKKITIGGLACVPGLGNSSVAESYGCGKMDAEIEKLITQKDAVYPIFSGTYNPEEEDTWWASAFDPTARRDLLDQMASKEIQGLDLDTEEGAKKLVAKIDPVQRRLDERNLRFIANTCSAGRWSCEGKGHCWRDLLTIPGVASETARRLSPAFDGAMSCLKEEMKEHQTFNTVIGVGVPLACAGIGLGGLGLSFFTGGASLVAAAGIGSAVCGLGAWATIDSKSQRDALIAFDNSRICTQMSGVLCTEEDVRTSEAALISAIFNKKVSLAAEVGGLLMEGVGVVKVGTELITEFGKISAKEKGLIVDMLRYMSKGKSAKTVSDVEETVLEMERVLAALVDGSTHLDELQLGMVMDLAKKGSKFNIDEFKALTDVQQMHQLRALYPGMADDSLQAIRSQLLSLKNPQKVFELSAVASQSGKKGAKQMREILEATTDDVEFTESVATLYVLKKQGKLSDDAAMELEELLARDPSTLEKLRRGSEGMGCNL